MSQTLIIKSCFPAKPLMAIMLIAASSAACAAESIDQLATRIGMDHFREAIKKGDRNAFKTLPAKGYKNGFSGLLLKTNTYINPAYSFADCDTDTIITSLQEHKRFPGCRISLKLATKDADGSYHDNGIRVEYGIAIGSKKFIANNSMWAQHAISGDKVLEGAVHPDKKNNHKDRTCMGMAQFTANVTEDRNGGMTKGEYYQRLDNMNGKPEVTPQMIALYKTFIDYVYEHPKQDAQVLSSFIYTTCMNNF
ncbi:hypothetical protein OJ965_18390 [Pantoea anthophila]|uniref:hypothetical protein n=1 Tax=Pantoea anthophila TaxID=470931 RepID=UPI0022362692|nr:hypothetical protein [Pantoea anthophila]UZH02623.1 hypothetical protein OJ965_18390 [Pantoea anthophila]